jgi:hypothetical protein
MGKMLEIADDLYQQLTTLAEQYHHTPEEMLRLCLLAYDQYHYHLAHQEMVAAGLLDALPLLRPLEADEEDIPLEVIPGQPLSDIIREERR